MMAGLVLTVFPSITATARSVALAALLAFGAGAAAAQDARCGDMADLADLRAEHLVKLNRIRVREGLGTLAPESRLDRVAQDYACLLARTGHFDHTGPDGSTPSQRVQAGGYTYCLIAENIAKGYQSVDTVLQGWVKSPGHLENIRRKGVVDLGFGVTYATTGGATPGRPASLSELAETLDGQPRDTVLPEQVYLWVQLFGKQC